MSQQPHVHSISARVATRRVDNSSRFISSLLAFLFTFCAFLFSYSILRISVTVFSNDYDDISGLCYCSVRLNGHHWPCRGSIASRDTRLPFVSSRFFMIYLLITNLLREMSQSGMCFYLFLQWMSSDFRNLRDAPGALHQH